MAAGKLPRWGLRPKAWPVGGQCGGAVAGRLPLPTTDHLLRGGPLQALAPQLRRRGPAWRDAGHVRQLMGDALVAVDARALAGDQVAAVDLGRPRPLHAEVHGDGDVAVAAFQGVVALQARHFVLGPPEALGEELLAGVGGSTEWSGS